MTRFKSKEDPRLSEEGVQWKLKQRLEDLEFANDVCLLAQRFSDIKMTLHRLLSTNIKKTKEKREDPSVKDNLSG